MAYISSSLVANQQAINTNAGKLCFRNIVVASNISATSQLSGFPATNLANPATAFGWEATTAVDQTITILNPSTTSIDYVGIARHNLSQPGLEVSIRFDGVVAQDFTVVSDKQALLFLFTSASPSTIQIDIRGITNPAKIAVLYIGRSLDLQRNIYVGHTPVNYGRDRSTINGVSQSGEFLGEIILDQTQSTSISLQNLTPEWYRSELDAFFAAKPRNPAFWAWRPGDYPAEVGYCWVEGNPRPVNQRSNGMMSIDWNFRGIE